MTEPNALTPTPGVTTSWHPTYEYRVNSSLSTSTFTVYSLYHIVNAGFIGGANSSYGIKVTHSTNSWSDYGSDIPDPLGFVTNGTSTEVWSDPIGTSGNTLMYSFVTPTSATWITGSGSGSGSGSGIQTLSGGSSPEIINVEFTKLTDSSISISFDWQNISNYTVFTDRGGTETNTSPSVTGANGSITGYTGAGSHALTGLNEGDRVWVANATDAYGNLPVYTHKFVDWSVDVSAGNVVAKTFGLSGEYLIEADNGHAPGLVPYSGNLLTLTTIRHPRKRVYRVLHLAGNGTETYYGQPYTTGASKVRRNFW